MARQEPSGSGPRARPRCCLLPTAVDDCRVPPRVLLAAHAQGHPRCHWLPQSPRACCRGR
eukprot:11666271-Alexandrium_andersonii.AAC.1